jgi:hypothetical protein
VKTLVKGLSKEQTGRRQFARTTSLEQIVALVESKRGMKWGAFSERHGDWGRDLVLYLARKRSGLTLRQISDGLGGLDYRAAAKAVQRFEATLLSDRERRLLAEQCLSEMSDVQT